MVKGANVGLAGLSEDAGSVMVSLSWSSADGDGDADVSVLLLNSDGKVRSDSDFFFYNNLAAPDGSVQLLGKAPTENGSEDRIGLDLTAIPADVDRIVVAASRYAGAQFGELDDLRVAVADRAGEPLLGYFIGTAETETAFLFAELYRRAGEWKFRAIGQGYDSGLAGLATDFGIDVDDDGEAEAGEGPTRLGEDPAPVTTSLAAAGPAMTTSVKEDPSTVRVPRPRTVKKKITLPKTPKKSLAESDAWQRARLFPASSLKSDRDRETRATSLLLAVMAQVPEFGRRLTAGFGAPAGRMETFAEVSFPHGDTPKRPDGVIRIERAGKLWTALLETKTNGNPLKGDQIRDYLDIAARRGYEAVITLSNDVALEGRPIVDVKPDARRKHKVALWHLSWAEVTHQAQMLIRHDGVGDAAHAWLLQELLYYLQHENSGCHGFQNMGPAWVPVRNGIDDETLCLGDSRALDVVESWERLIRQVCLRLGGELGVKVLPVQGTRRVADPQARRAALADQLCTEGRLQAEIRVEGTAGAVAVTADLRTGRLRTSVDVPAPEQGYPLTWAKRLVRQLAEAPADLHIETLTDAPSGGPRGTLERLRPEPADMLPKGDASIKGFRLYLIRGLGSTRGTAESGFIRSVDDAIDRFYAGVVAYLERSPVPKSPRPVSTV